ncbi:MAG: hypothetical protein LBR67_02685 [Dysgonamonadaceae bacterium]|jgi:hypothetical protein|nr:hypothetical protein [Dysgonamonadaceae bacterium]
MNQIFTPDEWEEHCLEAVKSNDVSICREPCPQILALIMQFSHSYHVERSLPSNLSGMVLN